MVVISKIGVLSACKVMGCLNALLELFIGGLFLLISILAAAANARRKDMSTTLLIGIGTTVVPPLL